MSSEIKRKDAEEIAGRADDLFQAYAQGKLKVTIDQVFPLSDAAHAHETIEGRGTRGKLLLDILN